MRKLALALGLFLGGSLFAIGQESHGGGAMVCRNEEGRIKSAIPLAVELLDLWEAEALHHLPVKRRRAPMEDQIQAALARLAELDPISGTRIRQSLALVRQKIVHLDPDVSIAPPTDAKHGFFKRGCPLEGAASYDDQAETLSLDDSIVDSMSETDRAALYLHEAIYKSLRKYEGETDSLHTRRIVGALFSETIVSPRDGVPAGAAYCETRQKEFSFYLFPREGKQRLQFLVIDGKRMLGKTGADVALDPLLVESFFTDRPVMEEDPGDRDLTATEKRHFRVSFTTTSDLEEALPLRFYPFFEDEMDAAHGRSAVFYPEIAVWQPGRHSYRVRCRR